MGMRHLLCAAGAVLVFVIDRFRLVPVLLSEPLIVTRSDPFSLIRAPVAEPLICLGLPVG